ncbi:hypothetical protein EZV62_020925 [Acer yangbiense]|uniref:Uncharacterized protein n=1 Tax=Acer yangbiense TaxID=1000413 RepID=A0A5C7HFQ3_9ROSI|nr:hypothetical protein EZV62_020925 [Acer yangbiense]
MEVVIEIVGKIFDRLFDATWRQFGYLYRYKDTIKRLTDEAEKLEGTRQRVQAKIDAATTKGEDIFSDADKWIRSVDVITTKAKEFLKEEDKANKRCLKGMCIDPCSRYRFSKEAQGKIEAISNLQQEGHFESVSCKASPPGLITSSALSGNFPSRESITKEIMKSLKDENVSIIGICGMGGVGKTTLVTEISKRAIENKLFDKVAMAVVSQTQNYEKIQGEIASLLDMELPDKEGERGRARVLWNRIMKMHKLKQEREQKPELEKILIILDDVWEGIKLEKVGIPFGDDRRGCTIVLTSRIEDVCARMKAKIFKVGTLSKEESWGLFRDVAGGIVDNDDINPIARDVADECGGLPIALVTVAGELSNRKSMHEWIDAAQQLKKSAPTNIEGLDQIVFPCLKLSYNFLRYKEQQSVFLLCCLFPEDFDIPIELLMKYGMGLRLFQEVDAVDEARARTHKVVRILIASFLLIPGNDEQHVKMHDIVRDFAIKLSKDEQMFMVKAGIQSRNWPSADTFENVTGISLMYHDLREVPDGLEYPKLQALLLQQNSSLIVSNNFFEGMKDLKVLDLSSINFRSLPTSISLLTNVRTVCLNNCNFVNDSIDRIGKLTKLEILSLSSSNVREIPVEFSQLTSLRLFDLTNCKLLRRIPQNVISCLGKLEELYMKNSFMEWNFGSNARVIELQASPDDISLHFTLPTQFRFFDFSDRTKLRELPQGIVLGLKKLELVHMAIGSKKLDFEQGGDSSSNARVTELQALSKLTSLHIHIPGIRALPSDMPFQKLTNFVIGIGKSMAYNSCPSSRTLSLSDSITPQVDWFKNLLKKTENLYLCRIKGLNVVSPDFDDAVFNKLKSLTLAECEEIMYLLNTSKQTPDDVVFHNLEQLSLFGNPKLVAICKGELPDKSWSRVKAIDVNACHSMSSIVTSHLLQRLRSLQRFQAVNCEKVVYAFDFEELVIAKEETYKLLPMLQTLELTMLTKMEQVWKGDSQLMSLCNLKRLKLDYCLELKKLFSPALQQTLLSLEHLEVICCYKLEEIFGKIQEAQATASPSLGKLRFILMKSCTQLKTLFVPSIVESLVQLGTLKVQSCTTMKEVIADEKGEGAAKKKRIVFPNLYEIHLERLDSLICFCPYTTLEFPALEILRIDECPKMKMFGYGDQITPKLKKVLQGTKEHWFGSLNLTVQQLFKEEQQRKLVQRKSSPSNAASTYDYEWPPPTAEY